MAFQHRLYGDVLVVRWENPEAGDARAFQQCAMNARAELGAPPVYISIIPSTGAMPSDEVRDEVKDSLERLLENTRSIHLVLEGSGLVQATKRMIAAGFLILKGTQKMKVHENLAEALQASNVASSETEELLQKAKADGLSA